MTKLRQTIARRLKEAQNTAAMLTTFNEVDMTNVMALRDRLKDDFEKKHGARLGFMSFFVKASIAALKELPAVNAEIEGDDIVYKNYYDIGVAVGTPNGLVVPVNDTAGLAESIRRYFADDVLRARLRAAAVSSVVDYGPEPVFGKLDGILEQAAARP